MSSSMCDHGKWSNEPCETCDELAKFNPRFEPDEKSNFPHVFEYVVQAFDEVDGWMDTQFGHDYLSVAIGEGIRQASHPSRWMGGKVGKLRVVERIAPNS